MTGNSVPVQKSRQETVCDMNSDSVTAHLLGPPRFDRGGAQVAVPPASLKLLAYLLTRPGRRATREQLMETWGDHGADTTARHRLNTAVWRLRCAFEPDTALREGIVISTQQGLAVVPGCLQWVDVEQFDRGCRATRPLAQWTPEDAVAVRQGLHLYTGEFLEGHYDDWALAERRRLAELYVAALLRMVRWHDRRDEAEAALQYAQTAAEADPLREDLQRLLMRQYRRAGLPEMAVHHYETCRVLLAAELGVEPLPETREAGLGLAAHSAPFPQPDSVRAARAILAELEHTRDELRAATNRVERSIGVLRRHLASGAMAP